MKNRIGLFCRVACFALLLAACSKDDMEEGAKKPEPPVPPPGPVETDTSGDRFYPRPEVFAALGLDPDENGETLLDFSRVGYRWGDEEIPNLPVVRTLEPPAGGADATALINGAIAELAAKPLVQRGAILLKAGEYRVAGVIALNVSGIVLRGEGRSETTGTRLVATSTAPGFDASGEPDTFLNVCGTQPRKDLNVPVSPNITDEYVPAGRFWVRLSNASSFAVGDEVVVQRCVTGDWLDDLGMTSIAGISQQWTVALIDYKKMERVVTRIAGDTLWFENPVSICIERKYGGGKVYKYTYDNGRLSGCGVENMFLTTTSTSLLNENHRAAAVSVNRAEHCWVRGVDSKRFAFSGVDIRQYAKNITVEECRVTEMHAEMKGSRRYPFLVKGQLSLVKNCYSESGRHAVATSSPTTNGPNVFLDCIARECYVDNGPHARLATGTLYDNVRIYRATTPLGGQSVTGKWTGALALIDRYEVGPGHGWAEINGALWNCTTDGNTCVQRPPVSGNNYSVGCCGTDWEGHVVRPPGKKVSFGIPVIPRSLYETQLELRRSVQPGGALILR